MNSDKIHIGDRGLASDKVALVLSAMGRLMEDLRDQDLQLQDAVSELTAHSQATGPQLLHMQHIDLVTQTHDELSRFLPELAACLTHRVAFDRQELQEKLTLQSLKDQLLETESNTEIVSTEPPGELSLF